MATTIERRPLYHWLALGFGAGLTPRAPGTAGTLAAIPIYLLLSHLPVLPYLGVVAMLAVLGIWICGRTADRMGSKDPSAIVWDEIVGFLLTMTAAPAGWAWILAGFVVFRLIDILKPWPIRWLDRHVVGGLGIMLDDLLAGLLAWLALLIAARLIG